jgi:ribosome-associated protein
MDDDAFLAVDGGVRIPRTELSYRATRSGGPGGQHVNTTATRVELTWNVIASPALDDAQRARVLERLGTRIDGNGVLRLVSDARRSQLRNREAVTERLRTLVAAALHEPKPRRPTRPTAASKEERLAGKRRRSEAKRRRGRVDDDG